MVEESLHKAEIRTIGQLPMCRSEEERICDGDKRKGAAGGIS